MKKRSLKQRPFALSIAEHPQTFNAITKGKRNLNTALALKIEKELQLEEGTLVFLQAYYDIKEEKNKQGNSTPDLSLPRQSLFWDTDINRIDWSRQYIAVIERVFEGGNNEEKEEITRFYGEAKVKSVLRSQGKKLPSIRDENL